MLEVMEIERREYIRILLGKEIVRFDEYYGKIRKKKYRKGKRDI